jgi:hypothetical protein
MNALERIFAAQLTLDYSGGSYAKAVSAPRSATALQNAVGARLIRCRMALATV